MTFLKLTSVFSCDAIWLNANEIYSFKRVRVCDSSCTEIRLKSGKSYNVREDPEEVAKMLEGGD